MSSVESTVEIHKKLLAILVRFHEVCMANDIKYSIHGGTMLGAIRENGFIAWDDDVDVSLTREEYEKLKIVLKRDTDYGLIFETDSNRFPRVWMVFEDKSCVYLDIFIYDYISANKVVQKLKLCGLAFFLAILKTKNTLYMGKLHGKYKGWKYALIWCGYTASKIIPRRTKLKWADRFAQRLAGNKEYIHRANDVYLGIIHILPKYVMSEYEMIRFEDTELMISKYAHEIMRDNFGDDYMTPKRDDNSSGDLNTHIITRQLEEETIHQIIKERGIKL